MTGEYPLHPDTEYVLEVFEYYAGFLNENLAMKIALQKFAHLPWFQEIVSDLQSLGYIGYGN